MNLMTPTAAHVPSTPAAPYAVDVSKGTVRGDVSAQWASRPGDERFDTLGELHDMKAALWERSLDVRLKSTSIDFIAPPMPTTDEFPDQAERHAEARRRMGLLKMGFAYSDGSDVQQVAQVAPTHWAFGQLAQLSKAPAAYLRTLPTEIVKDNLNWGLQYARSVEELKLFTTADECMAAQGPSYGRIGDHEVVRALMAIAGQGKGEDSRYHWKAPGRLNWADGTYDPEALGPASDRTFYGSDRDMFVFLVDDRRPIQVGLTRDGKPDLMFRGFYVQNSMVGSRSLKLSTFYLRGVCMNRNLWGVEDFSEIMIRHTAGAPERWLQEVQPALEQYANASDVKLIEGVQRAKAKVLADSDEAAIKFLQDRSYSANAASKIMDQHMAEEGKPARTVWDFGQAITAFARTRINTDDRLDDELKAKRILDTVK